MTKLLDRDANQIPCGLCCRQLVRVRPTDDQLLPTEQCTDWGEHTPSDDEIATHGDQVLLRREDGYCVHLAPDLTHCLLVGETDRRPYNCREGWPDEACAALGCLKMKG